MHYTTRVQIAQEKEAAKRQAAIGSMATAINAMQLEKTPGVAMSHMDKFLRDLVGELPRNQSRKEAA